MRSYLSGAVALSLLLTGGLTPSVRAENLMHTQQLLTTKDCAGCDLTKAGLVYANLLGANLANANLVQANLSHADLSGANLSQTQLSGAVLFGANLSNTDLSGANLAGADLREAILTNANLEGANIQGANLMGAVGLPETLATVDNFYRWGLEEAARGNFRAAIGNYNQAISRDADFAHGYLARSIALFRLGDQAGALVDAQKAEQLYLAQNNERGQQVASQFAMGIEAAQEAYADQQEAQNGGGTGGNILNVIGGLAGMALQVLQYMAF